MHNFPADLFESRSSGCDGQVRNFHPKKATTSWVQLTGKLLAPASADTVTATATAIHIATAAPSQ